VIDGRTYRLGRSDDGTDLIFARGGNPLLTLQTREIARPDARQEIASLQAAGHDTWILSGDRNERVQRFAHEMGVPAEHALGQQSPQDKASWMRQKALFLGDGINDSLAAESALCSGTPALDRPFMASRCDFVLCSPALSPLRKLLGSARLLRQTVRRNLVLAIGYNAIGVGLCFAGLMHPWLAAVLMPLSSAAVVSHTVLSLTDSRLTRSA
jgi:Cu2+-exporting ATPase